MRRYKVRCVCVACRKLRIVTPLYETTKDERDRMKRNYVCPDCAPECGQPTEQQRQACADCHAYTPTARLLTMSDGREACPRCAREAKNKAAAKRQRSMFCETASLFDLDGDSDGRAEALALFA